MDGTLRARARARAGRPVAALGAWSRLDGLAGGGESPRHAGSALVSRMPPGWPRRVATVVAGDVAPTVLIAFLLLVGSTNAAEGQVPPGRDLDGLAYLLLALAVAAFPLRRHAPLILLAVETVLIGSFLAVGYPHGPSSFAVAAAAYTVGVREPGRTAARAAKVSSTVVLAASAVSFARGHLEGGWDFSFTMVAIVATVILPAALGALLRLNRISSARADEEATRRRIEQERLRMAREVHDVVGHGLSIISLQAAVALHVLDRRPEQAQVALEAIRRTSVDALNELRATLALTRASDARSATPGTTRPRATTARTATPQTGDAQAGTAQATTPQTTTPQTTTPQTTTSQTSASQTSASQASAAPAQAATASQPGDTRAGGPDGTSAETDAERRPPDGPGEAIRVPLTGLGRLPGLVSEVRLCGIPVDLVTEGDLTALPAEVDLAAYRIVQESLTNVLRHAGPARARVTLRAAPGRLGVEIVDEPTEGSPDPAPPAPALDPSLGHGLRGLRERVDELGGSLTAGPRPGGGWRVRTELPTPTEPPRSAEHPRSTEHPRPTEPPAPAVSGPNSATSPRAGAPR